MRTILAALALAAALASPPAQATCTPIIDPGLGCVPPDRPTARCEVKFGDEIVKLLDAAMECRLKWAARPNVFDEARCLQTARTTFDGRMAKLLLKDGCPACLAPSVVPTGDAVELFTRSTNGQIFCDGTLPFGGVGDTGFRPPSGIAYTCERHLSLTSRSLARATARCYSRAATYALLGRSFDHAACDAKAMAHFVDENASFLDSHPHCPPCVGASPIAGIISGFPVVVMDNVAYCAPTD